MMVRTSRVHRLVVLVGALLISACAAPAASLPPSPSPTPSPTVTAAPTPSPTSTPVPTATPSPSATPAPSSGPPAIAIPGYAISAAPEAEAAFRTAIELSAGPANPLDYLAVSTATGPSGSVSIVLFGFTREPSSAAFLAVMQGLATAAGTTATSALGGRGFLIDAPGMAAALSIAGSAGTQRIYLLVTGTAPAVVEEVAGGALDDLR